MPDMISMYYYSIYLFSLLSFILAFLIYRSTGKATRGWYYLIVYIAASAVMPILSLLHYEAPGFVIWLRIFHIMLTLVSGIMILLAAATFLKDFSILAWWNAERMLYAYGGLFSVLIIAGIFTQPSELLLSGISYYALSAALIIAGHSFMRIFARVKQLHWLLLSSYALLEGFSLMAIAHIQGCCTASPAIAGCLGIAGTSASPITYLCGAGVVSWYGALIWVSLFSWLIGLTAYLAVYLFWKKTLS